ncbi:MAG: META domain-containing protein [Muribaculaceae bacterium]|nr:META domain-containing protein [Muribaculaceae bacterium]
MKKSGIIISVTAAVCLTFGGCAELNIPFLNKRTAPAESTPAELPTDREHLRHAGHIEKSFAIQDLEEGVVTGDWTIEEVNGDKTVGDIPPFIKFVPSEKRIYGNNGCNTINATYEYNKEEKTLRFGHIATTMRLCAGELTDLDINAALANTTNYSWDHHEDEYYIYLQDANGVVLLKLMHQNFDFLNGTWQVTAIEDEPVSNAEMRLVIDVDEGKIHGNTGCNILNGTMDVDMETANTLSFQDIVTTQMNCPNAAEQTRMIVALEDAAHAKPVDGDHVLLLNLLRKPVLTLKRI